MSNFIGRRLLQAIFVMLSVAAISFSLFRFVGDPLSALVTENDSAAYRDQLRQNLGLNDPIVVQYGRFIWEGLHGRFGISYSYREPVATLIAQRLPATLELVLSSAIFALGVGLPLGVYTALRSENLSSQVLQVVSLVGVSVPAFLLGIILILFFSVKLRVLPAFGRGEVMQLGWWTTGFLTSSGIKALIMPVMTLGLYQVTLIMRLVRSEILEIMRTDYIRFARARGLPAYRIYFKHAMKNALVPVITVTGIQVGSLIAFDVVTESVFQWPGMGLLLIQAVSSVDVPVLACYLTLVGFAFVVINLTVDALCFAVNPRIRSGLR